MTPLEHTIARLGGAATRRQLLASGADGLDITNAVRARRIIRIRQARYVTEATPFEIRVAARVGGLLAGPSAARTFGLWGGSGRVIHIAVAPNASRLRTASPPRFTDGPAWSDRPRARIEVHWAAGCRVPELGPECWRVTLERCLLQTVAWCDRETALACLDTALTKGLVSSTGLRQLFRREPVRSKLIAATAKAGSGSGAESIVCRRLGALGMATVQQFAVPGVGRVDLLVAGTRIIVEVDGRTYHEDPAAFEEDRRRDAELIARGYVVVRLSYLRVMTDWAWCARMVLAALAQH